MTSVVKFENVTKNYPYYHHITGGIKNLIFNLPKAMKEVGSMSFNALNNISFDIKKGETVALIGRNGAGKSTSLGLIAEVLKPNKGSVIVNGRISPLLELGGGFHPELNGVENIKLNGVLLGLTRQQVKEKIDDIIKFSELGDFIHHPIRTYSSGMLARLGFSVIAHLEPDILLIDEVLAVGDAGFQKKCLAKMEEFKKLGITIILVTHSTYDVEKLCERCIWIENHQVKMDGPTNKVIPEYKKFFNITSEDKP